MTIICISCGNKSKNQFKPDLIPVQVGDRWGYVNLEGKYEINPQFSYAGYFVENIALVRSSDKFGYIDVKGSYIINPQYKYASNFSEGLAIVVPENGKIRYIDKEGEIKIELKDADFAGNFHNGLAKYKLNGKWGFIDKSGKTIINPQYDNVFDFTENLAAISIKNDNEETLWGFIDITGKTVVNPQFKNVQPFSNGLACVSIDSKQFGYIDKTGKYIINPQFEEATNFFGNVAAFKQGNFWGLIDKSGKIVVNPQFDYILLPPSNNLIAVLSDDKWGYIDMAGKYMINPQFDKATSFIGKIAIVEFSDKIGFIDKNGTYIVNPQFDAFVPTTYFLSYGVGYTFSQIESDFFDLILFVNNAFNNNIFGLNRNSTVENIIDFFDVDINDFYRKKLILNKNPKLLEYETDDIKIEELILEFENETFKYENSYENYKDYWGNTRQRYSGSIKVPNKSSKLSNIEIEIKLNKKGIGKAKNLSNAIEKVLIENYKVINNTNKELEDENVVLLYDNEKSTLVFITFEDNTLSLYISFDNDSNIEIIEYIISK